MNTDLPPAGEPIKTFPGRIFEKMAFVREHRKKVLEYAGMIALLTVIYYCYFVRDAKMNACSPDIEVTFSQLGVMILRFFVFTSWPFALMAFFDSEWRSKDAGNVFLAAYIGTNILWYHRTGCAFCIFAASFRIIPYVFCALVAHSLGARRHRVEHNPFK